MHKPTPHPLLPLHSYVQTHKHTHPRTSNYPSCTRTHSHPPTNTCTTPHHTHVYPYTHIFIPTHTHPRAHPTIHHALDIKAFRHDGVVTISRLTEFLGSLNKRTLYVWGSFAVDPADLHHPSCTHTHSHPPTKTHTHTHTTPTPTLSILAHSTAHTHAHESIHTCTHPHPHPHPHPLSPIHTRTPTDSHPRPPIHTHLKIPSSTVQCS